MQATTGLTFVFTAILLCVSTSIQAQPTTPPASNFPGPCRAWLFPCGKGSWVCTTEAAYWDFIHGPQPECPAVLPQTTAPPPGECQLVNGVCQFTNSMLKCKAWVDPLTGNKCGSVTEYDTFTKTLSPKGFGQYPAPNQLCLAINNTCQWYDPCISWKGHCMNGYICGSADEYYAFLHEPQPPCPEPPPGWVPPEPPGQCAIRKDHCDWYECASWMGWCDYSWECGTTYDRDSDEARPPPSCPVPPPGTHPPVQPGACLFNISLGHCNFSRYTNPCYQPIYPPGFLPSHCNALVKQWTYNSTTGQCLEFYYFPCAKMYGDGYDVFDTEEECTKTCVHQGPCSQPVYPPDFDSASCTNILRQWTYNPKAEKCVEFNYHQCGENRDGYDVFATELECTKTCVHQEGKKQ